MPKQCPHCKDLNPDDFEKCQWCGKRFDEPVKEEKIIPPSENITDSAASQPVKINIWMKLLPALLSLTAAGIIFIAVGVNVFLIWNLLPVIIFYFTARKRFIYWHELKNLSKICLLLLTLFLLVFPASLSTMWIFDIAQTATGSSTSGLIFIFIPIWSFLFGIVPLIILSVQKYKK